jgi:hypothetical protein
LRRFRDEAPADRSLPCTQHDYLNLVDYSGRVLRSDKRGAIPETLPPILKRLNIEPDAWRAFMQPQGNIFGRALGSLNHLKLHANALGQQWIKGLRQAERLYRTT